MSGSTLNDLLRAIFLQAADPPPPPPFVPGSDPRQAGSSQASGSSSSASANKDPAEQTLALLSRAQQLSDSLGVISSNDALRDISTSSLRVLFLSSLRSTLEQSVRTGTDHTARKQHLAASMEHARRFVSRTLALGVVPPTTRDLLRWQLASMPQDELSGLEALTSGGGRQAPHAREVKIAAFRLEKALERSLDDYRSAYRAKIKVSGSAPSEPFYDLLLYPSAGRGAAGADDDNDDDDEDEEVEADRDRDADETAAASAPGGIASPRQYLLALLNLHTVKAATTLQRASQELELLRSMPPPPPVGTSAGGRGEDVDVDPTWRLDRPLGGASSGPLMDPAGKVLRPFTITSSDPSKSRTELKSEVFRPGYRLPTMTIDEYLEEEQRRGNIIQGGGQASYDAPTSTEQRQLRMENDGTQDAQDAEEEQRQHDIYWDDFTESNRRGAGNTMNRG
ncbi:TAP42-domain-containing protein [Testicularia cyperi]|uniref:TAP42-domain-containing protein n=1 Tax=Testicularia cyperi TaxID=1882483 RepID=A0A317XI43_9BASI|nr:TAP42-domain-containing protein [Testicularia cyperi]